MSVAQVIEIAPDSGKMQRPFNVDRLRMDFPILQRRIHGKPLAYLDNAASTQKPRMVIDAMTRFYEEVYANILRGVDRLCVDRLSQEATEAFEESRIKVQRFLNAADSKEIVFVRGATEAINLVASTFGRQRIGEGDEIVLTEMEHHSNIVPWQMLCEEKGARIRVAPMTDEGELDMEAFAALLNERTRLVSVVHVSNALGTVNPVKSIVELAHAHGAAVLIDGAQATPHVKIDVQELDCDFYVFSGHKNYGPTGIGALYGKQAILEDMPPYHGGGDMILYVTFEKTLYNALPHKFEAGTPNIAGGVGLGAAIDYLTAIGIENVAAHETAILNYATERVQAIPGLKIVGTAKEKAGVLSFVLEQVHPHDLGTILDNEGVAIRTGHHCAQPAMERLGLPGTARASFACYNTLEEVDALVEGIRKAVEVFS